jgi:hypothetical protein
MTTAHLGSSTRGIWTRSEALEVLTRRQVDGRVARGEWQSPWPGVYADAGFALDGAQRGWAAVLGSGRGAVVCGRLAARLHALPLIDDDDPATKRYEHLVEDVAVPHDAAALVRTDAWGQERRLLRHRRSYDEEDVTTVSGVPVTTVLQTVVDCAGLLRPDALVCLLDAALHQARVTTQQLADLVASRRWRPGVVALRAAVTVADGRSESPLETLGRLLLAPYLPGLQPQHRLRDEQGRVLARFDLAHALLRLALEGDGRAAHEGSRSAAKDQRRDRVSDRRGWRTERFTWFEVRCRRDELVRRVLEAGREQARRHQLRIV